MAEPQKISCSFSLFDDGRQYTGNHRKYLVTNAREICYSATTRERLALREAYGYYGHGRRILAGRMKIGEVEAVTLPDGGTAIISNIPSNVTIAFDVAEDGTVSHTQELLTTETGNIVKGLHESRVGGFSWACPGTDRGSKGTTHLSGFAGFDYVLSPGFSTNRGYVLESADDAEQGILESVAATLKDDARAEQYVRGWMRDYQARIAQLENELFRLESNGAEMAAEQGALKSIAEEAAATREKAFQEAEALKSAVAETMKALNDALPIFIPEGAMHAMLNGDFSRAKAIFESASRIDFGQYPLSHMRQQETNNPQIHAPQQEPEFGTADYGEGLFSQRYEF